MKHIGLRDFFAAQRLAVGDDPKIAYEKADDMLYQRTQGQDRWESNRDGSVAIDPYVSYYPMSTCPTHMKVQLHTIGGISMHGAIKTSEERNNYKGWRPLPQGADDDC